MKLVAEQCSVINISNLQKTVRRNLDLNNPDATDEEIFKYTEDELNKFQINGQGFSYTFMKNILGGYRWFFQCGKCRARVQKLFLPPEIFPGYERKYLCKECHNLCNESVLKAKNKIYRRVIQPLKKLQAIETKLEKGHLTEKKTVELLDEYDGIEQEMKNCLEYRQYVFKKKRGLKLI